MLLGQFQSSSLHRAVDSRHKQVSEVLPLPGGRINATNMSLKNLIGVAYRLKPFQISGGQGWLDSARSDIVGSFPLSDCSTNSRVGDEGSQEPALPSRS